MTFIQRAYQLEEKKNNIPELENKTPSSVQSSIRTLDIPGSEVSGSVMKKNPSLDQSSNQTFGSPESEVSESALKTNPIPDKPRVQSPLIQNFESPGSKASESVLKKIPTTQELIASIQAKELQEQNAQILEFNLENTIAIWEAWKDQIPQDSIKALLIGVKLDIQGNEIEVTVGSSLAESAIKAQPELMEEFRKKFSNRELNLNIKVEKTEISDKQKINKPLTNKEKFQSMVAANPLVEELQKKLELTFDDEY